MRTGRLFIVSVTKSDFRQFECQNVRPDPICAEGWR